MEPRFRGAKLAPADAGVQWTGPSPAQACPERSRRDPSNWQQIAYKHDVTGRRVEKKVDGYSTRYVHACDEPIR
ncbi:MAG: hypothetical protein ACYS74_09470, partial [Planctomycetota bacterium]